MSDNDLTDGEDDFAADASSDAVRPPAVVKPQPPRPAANVSGRRVVDGVGDGACDAADGNAPSPAADGGDAVSPKEASAVAVLAVASSTFDALDTAMTAKEAAAAALDATLARGGRCLEASELGAAHAQLAMLFGEVSGEG